LFLSVCTVGVLSSAISKLLIFGTLLAISAPNKLKKVLL